MSVKNGEEDGDDDDVGEEDGRDGEEGGTWDGQLAKEAEVLLERHAGSADGRDQTMAVL